MATPLPIWIGKRIRLLRSRKGWSQQILADHAGMNREHLSELENGKWDASSGLVARIAEALGVTLEEFFKGR